MQNFSDHIQYTRTQKAAPVENGHLIVTLPSIVNSKQQ